MLICKDEIMECGSHSSPTNLHAPRLVPGSWSQWSLLELFQVCLPSFLFTAFSVLQHKTIWPRVFGPGFRAMLFLTTHVLDKSMHQKDVNGFLKTLSSWEWICWKSVLPFQKQFEKKCSANQIEKENKRGLHFWVDVFNFISPKISITVRRESTQWQWSRAAYGWCREIHSC